MAVLRKMVSDITGAEADEAEFVTLIIREHPAVEVPKALDVLPSEIAGLKPAGDFVTLEVRDREPRTCIVALSEFRKLVQDETVVSARPTRGRRPGYSPKA